MSLAAELQSWVAVCDHSVIVTLSLHSWHMGLDTLVAAELAVSTCDRYKWQAAMIRKTLEPTRSQTDMVHILHNQRTLHKGIAKRGKSSVEHWCGTVV